MANDIQIKDPAAIGVAGLKGINTAPKDISTQYTPSITNKRDVLRVMRESANLPNTQFVGDVPTFNESRFDKNITTTEQLEDLNEVRAQSQS